jgi:hypothetical protein
MLVPTNDDPVRLTPRDYWTLTRYTVRAVASIVSGNDVAFDNVFADVEVFWAARRPCQ